MWTVSSLPVKRTSPGNVNCKNVKRKWSGHVFGYVMYFGMSCICVCHVLGYVVYFGIDFVSFYYFYMDKMSVNEAFRD
jgi:hypothetical protein